MKKLTAVSLATAIVFSVTGLYTSGASARSHVDMADQKMGTGGGDGRWAKHHGGAGKRMSEGRDHGQRGGMGGKGGMSGKGGMGGKGGAKMGMAFFKSLDADGDGAVTAEEAANFKPRPIHMIKSLDTDKDGVVTSAEIDAWLTKRRDKYLQRFDVNNDGVISQADQTARMEQRFARFDANKDGKVTKEEFGEVMSQWRQKRREGLSQMRRDFWGRGAE